MTVQNLHVVYH